MFGGGELADIGADFAEEGEDGLDADEGDKVLKELQQLTIGLQL